MPPFYTVFSQASVTTAPGLTPGVAPGGDLIPLRAAFGQGEANHGTVRFEVDSNGLVRVPREAVSALLTVGGFILARTGDDASSAGLVKLHHDDASGCSYAGCQYTPNSTGDVLVPAEAASELYGHGFVPVFEPATMASHRVRSSSKVR